MTADEATEVLEATLEAVATRDWDQLSALLIGVRTNPGEHPSTDRLSEEFEDIELEDYDIEEITRTAECRSDAVVQLTRSGYGRRETSVQDLTLFRVDDNGRPDPNGSWTVTNPIDLRSMPAE